MKELMKRYNERTAVRLKEYDEQKKKKQKIYKEKKDKDIKEIIVKDKIQKQLTKQLSKLEKVTDTDDLFKGKNEKKVATKGKKGRKKNKKTLGQTLSEWNILPNIDMYEWIPFSSKEAKVDCNIKNIKQALTRVGYIGPNKFVTLGSKDGKDAIDMDNLFSSIMSSSNALYQKYIDKDDTSNGSSFKKQSGFLSFALYALWEIFEHIVLPVVTSMLFQSSGSESQGTASVTPGNGASSVGGSVNGTPVGECHGHVGHAHGSQGAHCVSVLYESFIALYTIASILLILYYILKYYRKIRMEKKEKYMKILQD